MLKGIMKLMVCGFVMLLTACYGDSPRRSEALPEQVSDSIEVRDTLTFGSVHHYSVNYNFVVKADSLVLLRQQPEEQMLELLTDSFSVGKGEQLVVADVRTIPNDTIDSVWVQVATKASAFGWIHESELLPMVVPDDPISQFISFFSDTHILLSLIIVILLVFGYTIRRLFRQKAHLVFFNDIDSFYPTLLALIVAVAATLYASIQMFATDVWRHFYYHPTLNPFSVPLLLGVFLSAVWAMLIVGLAAADDVRRQLSFGDAFMYLAGLGGVCAVEYIVFSITTLYYIGYVLLAVYVAFCLRHYYVHYYPRFLCGHCGRKIRNKGRCPYCGAMNV
ncbi:MAG: zinc ribbon domain-containing protein [Prevotella sp.]|nr:zinc ribbon domain-containing protein [Prevotella sp.]